MWSNANGVAGTITLKVQGHSVPTCRTSLSPHCLSQGFPEAFRALPLCFGSRPPTFSCSEPHEDVHTHRPFNFPGHSYSPLSQRLHVGSLHSVCGSKTYLDGWQDVSKQVEPTSISQEISPLKKTYFQKQKGSPSTPSRNAEMGLHFCLAVELSSCHPTGWYSVHLALVPRAVSTNPPRPHPSSPLSPMTSLASASIPVP